MYQITLFKMLSNTVLQVLFSCVHGFGPEKYLSTLDLRKWHNNPNIFSISKYGNFLQHVLRSGMHLVCVHNLLGVIWLNSKWKQGVLILSAATSTHWFTWHWLNIQSVYCRISPTLHWIFTQCTYWLAWHWLNIPSVNLLVGLTLTEYSGRVLSD